jgi:hypothetical protein
MNDEHDIGKEDEEEEEKNKWGRGEERMCQINLNVLLFFI